MRKLDGWMGAALWALVAVMLPMSALEPVGAARAAQPTARPYAAGSCADGAMLALGCESIHL